MVVKFSSWSVKNNQLNLNKKKYEIINKYVFFMNPKFYTTKKFISRDKQNFGNTDKELDEVGRGRPGRPGPPQPRPPITWPSVKLLKPQDSICRRFWTWSTIKFFHTEGPTTSWWWSSHYIYRAKLLCWGLGNTSRNWCGSMLGNFHTKEERTSTSKEDLCW